MAAKRAMQAIIHATGMKYAIWPQIYSLRPIALPENRQVYPSTLLSGKVPQKAKSLHPLRAKVDTMQFAMLIGYCEYASLFF